MYYNEYFRLTLEDEYFVRLRNNIAELQKLNSEESIPDPTGALMTFTGFVNEVGIGRFSNGIAVEGVVVESIYFPSEEREASPREWARVTSAALKEAYKGFME